MKKVIKNGTIVTATDTYHADVLIENGVISQIGKIFHLRMQRSLMQKDVMCSQVALIHILT